jgi:hypothetical protein
MIEIFSLTILNLALAGANLYLALLNKRLQRDIVALVSRLHRFSARRPLTHTP